MANIIQVRRDTSINWNYANPYLAQGEYGYELDSSRFKIGDGLLNWNSLPYWGTGGQTGIQGVTGFYGQTGIQGETGLALGATGIQGLTGFYGQTGIQGLTGLQGQTGITGNVVYVQSVNGVRNSTDYSCILYASSYYINERDGGGSFVFSPTNTTDDDGGMTLKSNKTSTGRWKRIISDNDAINVHWFGARGKAINLDSTSTSDENLNYCKKLSNYFGTLGAAQAVYPHATALTNTVDWAGIQAAFNFVRSNQNSNGISIATVYIPKGGYIINETLIMYGKTGLRGDPGAGSGASTTSMNIRGTVLVSDKNFNNHLLWIKYIDSGDYFVPGFFVRDMGFNGYNQITDPVDGNTDGDVIHMSYTGTDSTTDPQVWLSTGECSSFDNVYISNAARVGLHCRSGAPFNSRNLSIFNSYSHAVRFVNPSSSIVMDTLSGDDNNGALVSLYSDNTGVYSRTASISLINMKFEKKTNSYGNTAINIEKYYGSLNLIGGSAKIGSATPLSSNIYTVINRSLGGDTETYATTINVVGFVCDQYVENFCVDESSSVYYTVPGTLDTSNSRVYNLQLGKNNSSYYGLPVLSNCPNYGSDASAVSGGLTKGMLYQTSGALKIVQ